MPQFLWLNTQESLSLAQKYALNQVPRIQTHKLLSYALRVGVTEEREPDALNSSKPEVLGLSVPGKPKKRQQTNQGRTRSRKRIAAPMGLL